MNKLTALSKLSSAYHYLFPTGAGQDALNMLSDKFHYVRRSMTLLDLAPQPKDAEGLNPAGPKYL
jgi:hypothetical protein